MFDGKYEVRDSLVYEIEGYSPEQIRGNFWDVLFGVTNYMK